MSQDDLDTVMMEDFGPDLDLLDELLMDPSIDWCKLEPSLSLNFGPASPHSPLGPELPMQGLMSQQPLTPETQVGSPASPQPQLVMLSQAQLSPIPQPVPVSTPMLSPLQVNNTVNANTVVATSSTLSEVASLLTPQVTTHTQPIQLGAFTGFGIPITQAMFNGNTVLLPQLQLAVVGNTTQIGKRGNKLPVKRLEKESGSGRGGGRKKEPTSRRSSHNAIERRYRSSINDKILELKNLVCAPSDPNEKVHKAAILRSSVDRIRYLQSTNGRLDKENRELKKSMSQCLTCRNDMTLRGILAGSPATPPTTEPEFTDSSNPPSPNEDLKPSKAAVIGKSPLLLFSLVAGLFLINPVSHHNNFTTGQDQHPHSRVERSLDDISTLIEPSDWSSLWLPRLQTVLINLMIFICIYFITARFISRRGRYSNEKLKLLRSRRPNAKLEDVESILKEFDHLPKFRVSRWMCTMSNLFILPFQLKRKQTNVKYVEIKEDLSGLYLDYAKRGGAGLLPYLRAINFSPTNKQIVIRALIQSKSKFLLKYVLLFTNFSDHSTFGTPEGLTFLKNSISRGISNASEFLFSNVSGDEASLMVCKFREDALTTGINQLFHVGSGSDLFRLVLKSCGRNDKTVQFWTTVMWTQAEWNRGGGRSETLRRLYRLNDELWSHLSSSKEPEPSSLLKAIRKIHLCKRSVMTNEVPSKETLDTASSYLRDAINTSTDKPRRVTQLIWCLAAEWILECRLELWEETREIAGFSKDLDNLRSLTHYNPASLPSVYLYEACQRLMNYAAPGRTQQLLDASLRQIRTNQRALLCNPADSDVTLVACEEAGSTTNCKLGKKSKEVNLVREKRKAFALYLKCKYLPNQVITCPGEKAGMLKEAMKGLEKIGEKKKISECLEMIRTLGQNVTLH